MKTLLLILGLLCFSPSIIHGQWIDPDNCWTCKDSKQHFASGFAIDAGLYVYLDDNSLANKPWKRVTIVAIAGAIYELGQMDVAKSQGVAGQPGYGFSFKDEALNVGGAMTFEFVLWGLKKIL